MAEKRRAWSGRVQIKGSDGTESDHSLIVRELPGAPSARRVRILTVGEGELILQPGGRFNYAPFAINTPSGTPQIHRLEGHAESLEGKVRGRFRLTRDGTETATGSFEVKLRVPPPS